MEFINLALILIGFVALAIYLKKPNFKKIYDFIRMLDADNYPNAYFEFKEFKLLLRTLNGLIYKNGRSEPWAKIFE